MITVLNPNKTLSNPHINSYENDFVILKPKSDVIDELEFRQLVAKYAYSLKPFALSLTHDRHDANDLIQESLLKALSNWEKFAVGTNLKGWLYTVIKNLFINNYRRNKKRNTIVVTGDVYMTNSSSSRSTNLGEANILMESVNQAIDLLRKEFKIPFMMHYNGFKYTEIANKLTLPIGTVKSRIHLARTELKQKLTRY